MDKLESLIGRSVSDVLYDIENDITNIATMFVVDVNPDNAKLLIGLNVKGRERLKTHIEQLIGDVLAAAQPRATLLPFKPPHVSAVLKEVE